jgi:hypothetical protein
MADALIIPTTADATALESGGESYTPDPWGRFDLPGGLAAELLATGGWKIWTPDDAPAFGEWVYLLPTIDEATEGELFPCFVGDTLGGGLPVGLRYRTVGATQIELGGSATYMTGPVVPDDLEAPAPGAVICTVPPAAVPVDNGQVIIGTSINFGTWVQTVVGFTPGAAETAFPGQILVNGWGEDSLAVACSVVYDAVAS